VNATDEREVLGRALLNFQARNGREDRAWSRDGAQPGRTLLILSDRERAEFIEHARYELQVKLRRAVPVTSGGVGNLQRQSQGQSL
jgi:hypothetical protein